MRERLRVLSHTYESIMNAKIEYIQNYRGGSRPKLKPKVFSMLSPPLSLPLSASRGGGGDIFGWLQTCCPQSKKTFSVAPPVVGCSFRDRSRLVPNGYD